MLKPQYPMFFKTIRARGNKAKDDSADRKLIAALIEKLDLLSFKFKAVFGSLHNHYILLDKQLHIIDFNHKASLLIKRLFGKRVHTGESLLSYLHPDSAAMIEAHCKRALAGETFEVERKLDCKGKPSTWWLFQYSPAYDDEGAIKGITFNAHDITRQKVYEDKLALQQNKLREISLMQSHDIRGPVCSIMGVMSIIKENGYKPDRKCLKFIETAANMLDQNTRHIVNYAQGVDD